MNDEEATDLAQRILEESGRDVSVAGLVPVWSPSLARTAWGIECGRLGHGTFYIWSERDWESWRATHGYALSGEAL